MEKRCIRLGGVILGAGRCAVCIPAMGESIATLRESAHAAKEAGADLIELRADSLPKDVYLLSGVDENGKTLTVVTYYTNEADMPVKELELDFGRDGVYEAYRLDAHCNGEKTAETSNLRFTMLPNSCLLLREI